MTGMLLRPSGADIEACESDVVLLNQNFKGRVELVIGECKTNGEITEEDVRKLSKVADIFPRSRLDVYILFAKTGRFSPDEIVRCRKANTPDRLRTILLSRRELEPYFVYEQAEEEFHLHGHSHSFDGMAQATKDIYFEPQPKSKPLKKYGNERFR